MECLISAIFAAFWWTASSLRWQVQSLGNCHSESLYGHLHRTNRSNRAWEQKTGSWVAFPPSAPHPSCGQVWAWKQRIDWSLSLIEHQWMLQVFLYIGQLLSELLHDVGECTNLSFLGTVGVNILRVGGSSGSWWAKMLLHVDGFCGFTISLTSQMEQKFSKWWGIIVPICFNWSSVITELSQQPRQN